MKALDDGNFARGIFVDLQKAFDTVDYSTLLSKLCHYRICGLANKWFESYLANHKQFVSINDFESSTLSITIKHCKVHHFADDTNLLIINKSLKRLNKLLNIDLKNLTNWLNGNKILLRFKNRTYYLKRT